MDSNRQVLRVHTSVVKSQVTGKVPPPDINYRIAHAQPVFFNKKNKEITDYKRNKYKQ